MGPAFQTRERRIELMPPKKLNEMVILAAIEGFEQQKTRIDDQITELRAMLSGAPAEPAASSEPATRKRRKMSEAGRKAIAEAQRKRWASSKGESEAPPKTVTAKPKRKMSAAGRKAISEATKKRWAAFHAAKQKKPAPAAKKAAAATA